MLGANFIRDNKNSFKKRNSNGYEKNQQTLTNFLKQIYII